MFEYFIFILLIICHGDLRWFPEISPKPLRRNFFGWQWFSCAPRLELQCPHSPGTSSSPPLAPGGALQVAPHPLHAVPKPDLQCHLQPPCPNCGVETRTGSEQRWWFVQQLSFSMEGDLAVVAEPVANSGMIKVNQARRWFICDFPVPCIGAGAAAYPTENLIRQTECYVSRHLQTRCAQD